MYIVFWGNTPARTPRAPLRVGAEPAGIAAPARASLASAPFWTADLLQPSLCQTPFKIHDGYHPGLHVNRFWSSARR